MHLRDKALATKRNYLECEKLYPTPTKNVGFHLNHEVDRIALSHCTQIDLFPELYIYIYIIHDNDNQY